MKKQLFSSMLAFGFVWATARPATAANAQTAAAVLTPQPEIITTTPQTPSTAIVQPTTPSVGSVVGGVINSIPATAGTAAQNIVTTTATSTGNRVIQTGTAGLTSLASQQTSGIVKGINSIPFVGGALGQMVQSKISAGIGDIVQMGTTGFTNLMSDPNNPLGSVGASVTGFLTSLGIGGGGNSNPNNAGAQAAAADSASQYTFSSYQSGVNAAVASLAQTFSIDGIRVLLANSVPTQGLTSAISDVQGRLAVADIGLNAIPSAQQQTDYAQAVTTGNNYIAQSVLNPTGQAAAQTQVSQTALAHQASVSYSNANLSTGDSLTTLQNISQQLTQGHQIELANANIASDNRNLAAAAVNESANYSALHIQDVQERKGQVQASQNKIMTGIAFLQEIGGLRQ